MPRKKRLDPDAEQVAVYLTPTEQLVMDVISVRRKKRHEVRISTSEIVADGLWKILTEVEGLNKASIENLLIVQKQVGEDADNVKVFPKKS
jgi:hypothetical protein